MSHLLNDKIAYLVSIKDRRAKRATEEKADKKEQDALEMEIRADILALDVPKYTSHDATVTPTERDFVQVEDMDAFIEYCEVNGEAHLLNVKPAQAATIEQIKLYGDDVLGVTIGHKNTLSVRKL